MSSHHGEDDKRGTCSLMQAAPDIAFEVCYVESVPSFVHFPKCVGAGVGAQPHHPFRGANLAGEQKRGAAMGRTLSNRTMNHG